MMRRVKAAALAAVFLAGWCGAAFAADCSGTVTTGTPKTLFSSSRIHGFFIVNNSADLMCIAFDAAAGSGSTCPAGSYPLVPGSATAMPGSFYTSAPGYIPTFASIASVGTGDVFSCTTW